MKILGNSSTKCNSDRGLYAPPRATLLYISFVREKRLHKHYLNGADAFRLKVWFRKENKEQDPKRYIDEIIEMY